MMNTEEVLGVAYEILANWVWPTEVKQREADRLDVLLTSSSDLAPIVTALRVKRLGYLSAITGIDLGPSMGAIEVLYHFCVASAAITLRLRISRKRPKVPSLSDIVPNAESFERELSEMFGVTVVGLRNPEPLYLPDAWPEDCYPLRKDFDREALSTQT